MSDPLPVILCGKTPQIATGVIASLKPEYEGIISSFQGLEQPHPPQLLNLPVLHVILSPSAGTAEIPAILRGEVPATTETENLGSKAYSKKAVAVIMGGGYDDAAIAEMRKACQGAGNVPWLRPDLTKAAPPLGPGYGEALVERVKALLKELAEKDEMGRDGVYFY